MPSGTSSGERSTRLRPSPIPGGRKRCTAVTETWRLSRPAVYKASVRTSSLANEGIAFSLDLVPPGGKLRRTRPEYTCTYVESGRVERYPPIDEEGPLVGDPSTYVGKLQHVADLVGRRNGVQPRADFGRKFHLRGQWKKETQQVTSTVKVFATFELCPRGGRTPSGC